MDFKPFLKTSAIPVHQKDLLGYTISQCYQPTASPISPFLCFILFTGLTHITETDGTLPQGTHCSPPTMVVVEEFHAQGDVIGQWPQVLHEQVQGPEQEPAGLFDILAAQPSHKLPVVAAIEEE